MGKHVLGIDVGASLSKTGLIQGKEDLKYEFKDYSNRVWTHDGVANVEDYDLDYSLAENVLDLTVRFHNEYEGDYVREVKAIKDAIESERWVLGNLAEDMSSNHQSIASDSMKLLQEEFYLNVLGIVYSTMVNKDIDAKEFALGVLLPPRDYYHDMKEVLYGVLTGKIEITNNTTGKVVTVDLDETTLTTKPESVVAFVACFIDEDNGITKAGEDYGDLLNVSIDMGHSTTDLAIMSEWKPQKNSFETLDKATGLLLTYFSKEIQKTFKGYLPPEEELIKAFYTGKLTAGAKKQQVVEELSAANSRFAKDLYKDVLQYLQARGIRLPQVASFMFSGGGSVEVKNARSVRHFFMKEVEKVSQFTESFTPEEYISIEDHVEYKERKSELSGVRYANIVGFTRGLVSFKMDLDEA